MAENKNGRAKRRLGLRNIFYHNTFVLVFSFSVALISWFVMASTVDTVDTRVIRDVPINVKLSTAAAEDGIKVFSQTYTTADLEVSGNSLITNKLTAEDFEVTATLNPSSTKLTGNTLQKATLQVRSVKTTSIADYTIVSTSPEEISVEYDRSKETAFTIEPALKYSADTGYYPGAPALSAETVTVSGPESSVNKISRAAVEYSLDSPLKADANFTCPVRLYDQNNQEITDLAGLYLEVDVDTVDVVIPVLRRKTVDIVASTVHQPKGFSSGRITVEPAQIDIVGTEEALASINEITLDTPIDFAELDVSQKNEIVMDIPLPAGVRNISAVGENAVSQAKVSVNLNGYSKAVVAVPADNFQLSNKPADRDVEFSTQSLEVTVIGSEAQVSKLTGDSFAVQVDLANFADRTGSLEVPATVTLPASGADSCWALGKYAVFVTLTDPSALEANGRMFYFPSEAVNAAPQE